MSAEGQRFGRSVDLGAANTTSASDRPKSPRLTHAELARQKLEELQVAQARSGDDTAGGVIVDGFYFHFAKAAEIERVAREVVTSWERYQGGTEQMDALVARLRVLVTP